MSAANHPWRAAAGGMLALLLGACASTAPEPATPSFDAAAAVAEVRAAGAADNDELQVRPLRNPQVEDLREQATALEGRGMHQAAADALDRALAINPDDPALLQDRAEVALLLGDLDAAERLAMQADRIGAGVGPLCRRHWETVAQVRSARPAAAQPPAATVAAARERRDACTVAPPERY